MDNLKSYWDSLSPAEKKLLAERSGSSYNTLCQLTNNHFVIGLDLARRLIKADKNIQIDWFIGDVNNK